MKSIIEHCEENGINIKYGSIKNTFGNVVDVYYGKKVVDIINKKTTLCKSEEECFYCVLDILNTVKPQINAHYILPFGKYKGEMIRDVPNSYLVWMCKNMKVNRNIKMYVDNL